MGNLVSAKEMAGAGGVDVKKSKSVLKVKLLKALFSK
jgi:hypothetical protein